MKKVSSNKKSYFKTGGGPNEHESFTEIDESIISACSGGTPNLNVRTFGSTRPSPIELSDDENMQIDKETEKENKLPKANKKKELPTRPIPKSQLIQNQIDSNETFQEKFLVLMEKRNEIEMDKLTLLKEERKERLEEKKNLLEYKLLKLEAKKSSNEIRQQKLDFLKESQLWIILSHTKYLLSSLTVKLKESNFVFILQIVFFLWSFNYIV